MYRHFRWLQAIENGSNSNAAKRKDARERRSNCDVENTMDGFFNRLLNKKNGAEAQKGHIADDIGDSC